MKNKIPLISQELSIIGQELDLKGELEFSGCTHIYGKVSGKLKGLADSEITFMPSSLIDGDVIGETLIVAGCIQGNVIAKKHLKIKSSARILGKIEAARLEIEYGSCVEAEIHMPETLRPQSV